MTLSFRTKIAGKPTFFVEQIINGMRDAGMPVSTMHVDVKMGLTLLDRFGQRCGRKIHTIREDKHGRWKAGQGIHFVINNRTPNRIQFLPVSPVKSTQQIIIRNLFNDRNVWIGEHQLSMSEIEALAKNDGFSSADDFWSWFSGQDFEGKIIHWTDYTYSF